MLQTDIQQYRVLRPAGGDAQAAVLAHDTVLDRTVVLRFVDAGGGAGDPLSGLAVARALARVEHAHLERVYRVGLADGRPFLVCEHVRGAALEAGTGSRDPERARAIGRAVAGALAALHRAGIAHGDVRGGNVILTDDGEIRLVGGRLLASAAPSPIDAGGGRPTLGATVAPAPWPRAPQRQRDDDLDATPLLADAAKRSARPRVEPPPDPVPSTDLPPSPSLDRAMSAPERRDLRALLALLADLAGTEPLLPRAWLLADDEALPAASQVLALLEAAPDPTAIEGGRLLPSPYRGLSTFQAEHAPFFFGRRDEVDRIVARLRDRPWLLVVGSSGNGKSSLVRAGIAPAVAAGALGERAGWDLASVVPGGHPLAALAAAWAPLHGDGAAALAELLAREPGAIAEWGQARSARGLLLVIDQLEEIFLAPAEERARFLEALSCFGTLTPGVRLIATMRSDRLGALAETRLGPELLSSTFLLEPMGERALREATVAPAERLGYGFESAAMVDELVAQTLAGGGVSLLSFVLAEVWAQRDATRSILPASALARLGNVQGALGRHAERVFALMPASERRAARRLLLALIGPEGERRKVAASELRDEGSDAAATRALATLVRERLVVAGAAESGAPAGTFELVHDALLSGWPRIRDWIDEATEARALRRRLSAAASAWSEQGRATELLWNDHQLRELEEVAKRPSVDSAPEREFIARSLRARRLRRLRRALLLLGPPLLIVGAAAAQWAGLRERQRAQGATVVSRARAEATRARVAEVASDSIRDEALRRFDDGDEEQAEAAWGRMLEARARVDARRAGALVELDEVLATSPDEGEARAVAADLTLARIVAAEEDPEMAEALRSRLALYDDGTRAAWLSRGARLSVETVPPGAALTLQRANSDGTLAPVPLPDRRADLALAPGSYLLVATLPGRHVTTAPIELEPGAHLALRLALPAASAVPAGFAYVPPGVFHYGSSDGEDVRRAMDAEPARAVELHGFLIARTETTWCQFRQYLTDQAPAKRAALERVFAPEAARAGCCAFDPACPRPTRLPVAGVSRDDALDYVAWLARKLPGARLCSEREWERAARGADARRYPHGDTLRPGDACSLPSAGAPCEVGEHPRSRSPFGVDDLIGNLWEWTAPAGAAATPGVLRGGSFSEEVGSPGLFIANRGLVLPQRRSEGFGIRVCADLGAGDLAH